MSEDDPKTAARKARNAPGVEASLRQFLNHDGPKGHSPEFQRGWTFAMEWPQAMKDEVNLRMAGGMSFDEAFEEVEEISLADTR